MMYIKNVGCFMPNSKGALKKVSARELKKILYVEDDADIQAIAEIALGEIGNFTLKICNSGKEALESLDDFIPDIVISDVMMPGTDGLTLLQKIKENPKYSNLPVIFMTAKAQYHETEKYLEFGAVKVIAKPFSPLSLSDEIKEVWNDLNL